MVLTFTNIYNKAVKTANQLQKFENLLISGNFFTKRLESSEKRLKLEFINKVELSNELSETIIEVFGMPKTEIFELNFERVTQSIEAINAILKAKQDTERLNAKAETERIAANEAKKAEIAEKKKAGIAAGKITA
jgi:hypothetical protein